ncbi:MAG: creatininase family protein [Bacteroidales bacterium]|nr:creatininase family protein [Bacteroidales bacterium]
MNRSAKILTLLLSGIFVMSSSYSAIAQAISVQWEELTAENFKVAVEKSQGVCIIPMGVIEKHGQQLPLGTDVYTAREISIRASKEEFAIVFPFYFAGQIFEAKQQPGTIAYSNELIFKLLDETCKEISRNGIKKIIIVNGHGGNNNLLRYFGQIQLESPRDYAVYLYTPEPDAETQKKITELRSSKTGGHADEVETSVMLAVRPDLVKMERVKSESGDDLNRLNVKNAYTGIWWYGKYPNHYAGEASGAKREIGEISLANSVRQLKEMIKAVKVDTQTIKLQNEFFKESENPLKTEARSK